MSTNLVSNITQVLSSSLVARIASSLGLDKTLTEKALAAGVPGLLAALTSLASNRAGAQALSGAIAQQQPGVLSSLATMIGGPAQKTLIDTGADTLTSLLGGPTTSALTNAIGQYAGFGDASSKSLMGLLGPVVMGVLGQQQRASGLDATGLANLLTSQKDNIARALPAGFSQYLGGTDILDSLVGSSDGRRPSAASDYSGSSRPSYTASSTQRRSAGSGASSSQWGWLIPALAAVAIGGLAWHWLSRPSLQEAANTPPPAKIETPVASGSNSVVPEVSSTIGTSTGVSGLGPMPAPFQALENLRGIKVGDADIGAQLANAVSGMRSSLTSIQDTTSAQAAVAPLASSANEFARLTKLLDQLPPEARKTVVNTIVATRPTLDQLFDKALAIPGASTLIKPTVDSIRSQFDTLTTA
jgi:hypothetical protein